MSKTLDLVFKLDVFMTNGFGSKFTDAAQKITELQNRTKTLNSTVNKVDAYKKQGKSLQTLQEKLTAARAKERQLADQVNFGTQANSKLRSEYSRAVAESQKLTQEYNKQKAALDNLGQSLTRSGVDLNNITISQERIRSESEKTEAALKRLANAQAKMNSFNPSQIWQDFKGDIMKAYGTLKVFEQPIKVNMQFEQQMANVRAVLNPVKEEFEALKAQALELGSTTQFTAMQAGQAQENLARAGYKPKDIMNMMPHVLTMAAADGMDLAQAASIMTKTLGQFDLDTSHSQRIADLLANTSANSNTNIVRLGEGLIKFAPLAKQMSISPEKALAMIGSVSNVYSDGSEAGLALTRAIERIAAPKKDGSAELAKLGIVTHNKAGRMREAPEILTALDAAFTKRGYGDMERAAAMKKIFGQFSTAMSAMTTQVKSGNYQTIEMKNYQEREGKAAAMSKLRNDTLQGDLTALGSAWEGFMIRVGKPLESWSRNIVQGITNALTYVNDLITKHGEIFDWAVKIGAVYAGWKIGETVLKYLSLTKEYIMSYRELHSAMKNVNDMMNATGAGSAIGGASSALTGVGTAAGGAATGVESIGTASTAAAGAVSTSAGSMLASLVPVGIVAAAIYLNWKRMNEEGIHMHDNLIKMKSAVGSNRDTTAAPRPSGRRRALGGLITRPEIALIGEAGPEAVIPLSPGKKSRGLQMLNMAAESLGVNMTAPVIQELSPMGGVGGSVMNENNIFDNAQRISESRTENNQVMNNANRMTMSPSVNITVNVQGGNLDEQGANNLAGSIYERVKEAFSELMNNQDRLSFA